MSKRIECLKRNFLWERVMEGKKDHLVRRDWAMHLKETGGLGVDNLVRKNEALLGKWLWRFSQESSLICCH